MGSSEGYAPRKIVVAVDFGTTYSGLTWAQTLRPELQVPIIQWPDATSGSLENITDDKVPTEIRYDGQDFIWGFQIPEYGQRHQWFKLNLDHTQSSLLRGVATGYIDLMAAPRSYDKTVDNFSTNYLTALRRHTKLVMRNKLPSSAVISTPVEHVITVPALWSDAPQSKTRESAEQVWIRQGSTFHKVSAPEAAATYPLDTIDPHNIEMGDTFILCDAGGDAVVLVPYKFDSLKPTLSVKKGSPSIDMLCGLTFLNRIYQEYIEDNLSSGVRREGADCGGMFTTSPNLRLPDSPLASPLLHIHQPTSSFHGRSYTAPVDAPPSGPLDADGLTKRVEYGENITRMKRNFSPRTYEFFMTWKNKCMDLLHACTDREKELEAEVQIIDNMVQSRHQLLHGQRGLCRMLVNEFNALSELRIRVEYSDYLAMACADPKKLKRPLGPKGKDNGYFGWKPIQWQQVASELQQEEAEAREREQLGLPPDNNIVMKWTETIDEASRLLGYQARIIRYQILAYAERNNVCHNGIHSMVNNAEFDDLAMRITEDKAALNAIYEGTRPRDQIDLREVIGRVQSMWFEHIRVNTWADGSLHLTSILSQKALDKTRSVERSSGTKEDSLG